MIETEKGKAEVTRFTIDLAIRLGLIATIVYVSVLLLRPIAALMMWAVILSVAVYPLFNLVRRRLHVRDGVAASLLSLLLLVLLLAPVVILAASAIESLDDYARLLLRGGHVVPPPPELVRDWPMVGERVYDFWLNASNDLRAIARDACRASSPRPVAGSAASRPASSSRCCSSPAPSSSPASCWPIRTNSPAPCATSPDEWLIRAARHFLEIAGSTIRNVSQGVIGIALLQSALLGIGMLVADVPFAGAITFVCLVLAIVQVGPNIVMIPVDHLGLDVPAGTARRPLHGLYRCHCCCSTMCCGRS